MLIQLFSVLCKYNVHGFFSLNSGLCFFLFCLLLHYGVKQRHRRAFFTRYESLYDPPKDIKTAIVCSTTIVSFIVWYRINNKITTINCFLVYPVFSGSAESIVLSLRLIKV